MAKKTTPPNDASEWTTVSLKVKRVLLVFPVYEDELFADNGEGDPPGDTTAWIPSEEKRLRHFKKKYCRKKELPVFIRVLETFDGWHEKNFLFNHLERTILYIFPGKYKAHLEEKKAKKTVSFKNRRRNSGECRTATLHYNTLVFV